MIVFSAIMPHPPESMPGIGSKASLLAISKTMKAFESLRRDLEAADPDTIIIISPHARLEKYAFVVNSSTELMGNLSQFGQDEVHSYKNNIEIANKIDFACLMSDNLPLNLRESPLDHGALIPLFHLTRNIKPKIVHLSFSLMSYQQHYRYGEIIQKIINNGNGERFAIIASGDLSHRLTENAPAGYSPEAKKFDQMVLRFLGANDLVSLMGMEQSMVGEAAECGIRSIIILLGILHGKNKSFKMLSYESPFGVGYLTGKFV